MASKRLEYFQDTGEPFREAVERLAKTHTADAAARILGYANCFTLRRALKNYGIEVEFQGAGLQYTYEGVKCSVRQHAQRLGLDMNTVYKRIENWGLCDRVFSEPLKDKNRYYTMDGETMTVREWAALKGLHINTVYGRAKIWGWCDRVFNEPLCPKAGRKGRRCGMAKGMNYGRTATPA